MCDTLVVGVCNDEYVYNNKQKDPVFSEEERLEIIKSIRYVDNAFLISPEETENKLLVWEQIHYDVLFSGDDWKGTPRYIKTEQIFSKFGISIEYLPYTEGISSSKIKEKLNEFR